MRQLLAHGTGYRPGLGPQVVDDAAIDELELEFDVVIDGDEAVANADTDVAVAS
ncbi:MAG: hypothetical protein IAG13_29585 [Deltaproteobacteria bacterium]|nr:hypothetical protein [Nannocystaceae bacterium]